MQIPENSGRVILINMVNNQGTTVQAMATSRIVDSRTVSLVFFRNSDEKILFIDGVQSVTINAASISGLSDRSVTNDEVSRVRSAFEQGISVDIGRGDSRYERPIHRDYPTNEVFTEQEARHLRNLVTTRNISGVGASLMESSHVIDRVASFFGAANNDNVVELNTTNHPALYAAVREANRMLPLDPPPRIFVVRGGARNFSTRGAAAAPIEGIGNVVVIGEELLNPIGPRWRLTHEELTAVMAHEYGHIFSDHAHNHAADENGADIQEEVEADIIAMRAGVRDRDLLSALVKIANNMDIPQTSMGSAGVPEARSRVLNLAVEDLLPEEKQPINAAIRPVGDIIGR